MAASLSRCQSEVTVLMCISQSTIDYITANIVRCFLLFFSFFFPFFPSALTPVRIFVQIKRCYDFTVSWQTARARLVVSYCSSRKAFMWVSPRLGGNSTCFYKSSPLRNTCTEQRLHCFLRSHIVKIERAQRQQQAGLLNHSSFLAPLGWLKSSCQKHSITTDAGRGERLTC